MNETKVVTPRKAMSFLTAVKTCWSKHSLSEGRATRAEFWWFVIFVNFTVVVIIFTIFPLIMAIPMSDMSKGLPIIAVVASFLFLIFAVMSAKMLFCATNRRLHDTGRSGWWQLFYLPLFLISVVIDDIPLEEPLDLYLILVFLLVGLIFASPILVVLCLKGQPEANKYGEPV